MIKKFIKWLFTPCNVERKIQSHKDNLVIKNPQNINRMF